jgi:four helix bundle protein
MESYRELEIYHESKRLAIQIHALSLTLPKFELYEEGSQIRRSSKAVTSGIVEGFARRRYKPDYVKHLIYSIAECDETLVHLDFLFATSSMKDKDVYEALRGNIVQRNLPSHQPPSTLIPWQIFHTPHWHKIVSSLAPKS